MKHKILWFCRIFVGSLFIFSGLVKANDPVGFGIKLEEYYAVFAERWSWTSFLFEAHWLMESVNLQAAFLTVLEVALGIALLMGLWRNLVGWLLLLLILFFTWLTGYSALTGSVTDCGCFGDFIPLTPWQSFYKDLVLLVLILILFFMRKGIKPVNPPALSIGLFLAVTGFAAWVNMHVLQHDVFLDWRPYAVGDNIQKQMEIPADAEPDVMEMRYVYKNISTGEKVTLEFLNTELKEKANLDKLTKYSNDKENWTLDTSYAEVKKKGFRPKIVDFAISDEKNAFITDDVLNYEDYVLMVVSSSFDHTSAEGWQKINAVQQAAEKEGLLTFALVGESREEIEKFRHAQQTAFPFYTADYKVCLTIARTNPNLVLMKKGTVIAKWAWRDVPDFKDIKQTYFPDRKSGSIGPLQVDMFGVGDAVARKLAAGKEDYADFYLQDSSGADQTTTVINDTDEVFMFVVNELGADKLTMEKWTAMLNVMKMLSDAQKPFIVVSSGTFNILGAMHKASGLQYAYYQGDHDVLSRIMETNAGLICIKNGKVTAKFAEGSWPADTTFLTH